MGVLHKQFLVEGGQVIARIFTMLWINTYRRPAGIPALSAALIGPLYRIPRGAVHHGGRVKFCLPPERRKLPLDERCAELRERMRRSA